MAANPPKSAGGRSKGDTWSIPFPKEAVLIGEGTFIREAEAYFSAHVRGTSLRTISADADPENEMPPGFPILGPWCLICDLVTSHRSLRIARKVLLNTSNVPFVVLASDPAELGEGELRNLLELGVSHVLPVPSSWDEAWAEIRKILARRLNPLLSVHSTKMWLVGVLQSVATQERNCCVRISSLSHGRGHSGARDHGTSLRVSPVGLLGEIYFREGQPVYAWSTRLQGDEAVIDLLQTSNVQIWVTESSWVPPVKNVHSPLQGVLLEFMRRKDLGQLEPPSGVLTSEDLGELSGGPSTKRLPVPQVPKGKAGRLVPLVGALVVAALVLLLSVLMRTLPASDPPGVQAKAPAPTAVPPPAPKAPAPPAPAPALELRAPEPERPPAPKEPPRALSLPIADKMMLEALLVPAGQFRMGSPDDEWGRDHDEGPTREVVFRAPFYMGRFEVTQEQYEAVMGQNPSQFRGPRRPVESVSSYEAQEFCERATRRAGREIRLPTEAEWEYACRAGSTTPFHGGPVLRAADCNFDARSGYNGPPDGLYRGKTTDVGSFAANAFGLYDMHGNVGEWCLDFYDPRAYDSASPAAPAFSPSRTERVWRGGAFNDPPRRCRAANREHYNPGGRDSTRGFRVVIPLDLEPSSNEPH
jgi:formylglycine-generating enzyme required for sulfatase activity